MLLAASSETPNLAVPSRAAVSLAPTPIVAPASTRSPAPVADVVAKVDEAKLREHLESVAAMGSRYPGTDGHARAVLYLEQVLRGYGAGVVRRGPAASGASLPVNVFAAFGPGANGVTSGGPIDLVLGAHYDSIADRTTGWRSASDPAPGANDNGTGVAGLLEIARVLADEERGGRLRRGVVLVFFDAEELGMLGSSLWARQPGGVGTLMLNLDMVGFSAPGKRKLDVVRYGNSGDLFDRAKAANDRYALSLQLVDRLLPADAKTWVDSTPFAMAGIPAITLTESYGQPGIDYPGYPGFHRVTDTPEEINNVAQWKAATQLALAMVLELAR